MFNKDVENPFYAKFLIYGLIASSYFLILTSSILATADQLVPSERVETHVNIRELPNSNSPIIGTLAPDDQIEVVGSVPRWYQVKLENGQFGFVSKAWTEIISTDHSIEFTIDIVDVSTGLAIIVRGEDFTLIYDGGSNDDKTTGDNNRLLRYLKSVAPELETIDHIILSHPHQDHALLLPDILANYDVKDVWDSGRVHDICKYRAFLIAVKEEPGVVYHSGRYNFGIHEINFPGNSECFSDQIPIQLEHGHRIENETITLGNDATMKFLHVDYSGHGNPNQNSLVVRFDLGQTMLLLMGDAEAGGRDNPDVPPSQTSIEGKLLSCCRDELRSDILIVGHHGSKTSSREVFLDAVGADTFIISSGPFNYNGIVLPDTEVKDELESRGQLYRTDLNDESCSTNPNRIGLDNNKPGGCDNIRIRIDGDGDYCAHYWPESESCDL